MPKQTKSVHVPVLLQEVLEYLAPKKGESFLDLTAGYGGHAASILEKTANPHDAVLVDRDEEAIEGLSKLFAKNSVRIIRSDFTSAAKKLLKEGKQFDLILADLGVSSPHLDKASRGFSMSKLGPLDMRMDRRQKLTAGTIVNDWPKDKLAELIHEFGEERKARSIAHSIVKLRPINSTEELTRAITQAARGRGKIHPATRTFQAIRIAVNSELELLEKGIDEFISLLKPGGRITIISFHSLEDRIVKAALKEHAGKGYDAKLMLLTKRPVVADRQEIAINPRARSAKLRAAVKTKTEGATNAYSGKK